MDDGDRKCDPLLVYTVLMTPSPGPASQALNQTEWSLLWTIAGVIVAVIAIFAAVWAARQWGTRRNLLQVDYRIRPVRTIHLTYPDGVVKIIEPNPSIQFDIELRLTNRGPQDILPEHFGGQELRFSFAPAKLFPEILKTNIDSGFLVLDSTYARLHPTRIGVRRSLYFILRVIDERPDLWVGTPLANVKVRRRRYRDKNADPLGFFTLPGSNRWVGSRVRDI